MQSLNLEVMRIVDSVAASMSAPSMGNLLSLTVFFVAHLPNNAGMGAA